MSHYIFNLRYRRRKHESTLSTLASKKIETSIRRNGQDLDVLFESAKTETLQLFEYDSNTQQYAREERRTMYSGSTGGTLTYPGDCRGLERMPRGRERECVWNQRQAIRRAVSPKGMAT